MYTARMAAEQAAACIAADNYTAATMLAYDENVNRVLGPELKLSTRLQKLIRFPWLFNMLMRLSAGNKKELQELMTCMALMKWTSGKSWRNRSFT